MKFKEFMLQNAVKVENEKYVVSDRFTDEEGKPIEWELRTISRQEEEEIMRTCYKPIERNGKKSNEFDEMLFTGKVIASCVVYPELDDVELQNSYGVMSSDKLLKNMLTSSEFLRLQIKVHNIGRKRMTLSEKVEQAKN